MAKRIAFGKSILRRALAVGLLCLAPIRAQTNWEWATPPQGPDLNRIARGNGVFVAVGSNTLSVSPDCKSWKSTIAKSPFGYNGLAFGAGIFLVQSASGKVITSTNGRDWAEHSLPADVDGAHIAFGNGIFLLLGNTRDSLVSFTSPDGVAWSRHNIGAPAGISSFAFGNGKFVFVALSNVLDPVCFLSADGAKWLYYDMGNMNVSMVFLHDRFMFRFRYDQLDFWKYSFDGIELVPVSTPDHFYFQFSAYKDGTYFLYGSSTLSTTDFAVWKESPAQYAGTLLDVYSDSSVIVSLARGGEIRTSADGIHFAIQAPGSPFPDLIKVINAGGVYYALSKYGDVFSSPDVKTWTLITRLGGGGSILQNLAYVNHSFLAVGKYGDIFFSPDGLDWAKYGSGGKYDFNSIGYAAGYYLVGNGGPFLCSKDGMGWGGCAAPSNTTALSMLEANGITLINLQPVTLDSNGLMKWGDAWNISSSVRINSIAYGSGKYVGAGYNFIGTSDDLVKWTVVDTASPYIFSDLVFANNRFAAISSQLFKGESNKILTSPDGITWTPHNPGEERNLVSLTFGDGKFIVGGPDGGIMVSAFDPPIAIRKPAGSGGGTPDMSIRCERAEIRIGSASWVEGRVYTAAI